MPKSLLAMMLVVSMAASAMPLISSAETGQIPILNFHSYKPTTELLAQAKAGNVQAQFRMGSHYFNQSGLDEIEGLPPYTAVFDMNRSRFWAEKAANTGYPPAVYFLGVIYLFGGPGVAPNCRKAILLIKKASAAGYAPAKRLLNKPAIIGRCG